MTTLVGYVRVARSEEPYQDQVDALDAAGCERIFVDVAGGRRAPRPGLQDALDYLRENDELTQLFTSDATAAPAPPAPPAFRSLSAREKDV
uniref:recombinase family protein n=1 Tax=Clavibacter michiganensis TaxID=28447 RepID=UPI00292DEC45